MTAIDLVPPPAVEEPPAPRAGRLTPSLGAVMGLGFVLWGLSIGLQRLDDNSFFTHLATGRLILHDGGIPRTDPYSFTAAGKPFLVQSWLPSALYALAERAAGGAGIVLLMGATCAALAGLVWRLSRCGDGLMARVLVVAPVMFVATSWWSERPLLFGLLFLGLTALAAEDHLDARWLVPVGALWVNSHGTVPYGFLLLVLLAAGSRLEGRSWHVERRALLWLLGGVALGACGPLGPRLLTSPLAVMQKSEAFHLITEWQAPNFVAHSEQAFLLTTALVVVGAARSRSWRLVLPAVVFGTLAATAARNLPVAQIATVAPLAASLRGLGTISDRARPKPAAVAAVALVALGALLTTAAVQRPAFNVTGYPVDAVDWLEQRGTIADPARHLVAREVVGNYLELRYGRDAHVFIDDRVDMYPQAVALDHRDLLRPGRDWEEVLDRYGATTILWERDSPLAALLELSPHWHIAWHDDDWIIADRT